MYLLEILLDYKLWLAFFKNRVVKLHHGMEKQIYTFIL